MPNPTEKNIQFGSISFSLEDIRAMLGELNDIVKEQGELEIAQLVRREEQTEEEFSDLKADLREKVFKILSTVTFEDGSAVHSSDPSIVQLAPNGPFIRSIYVSNLTPYRSNVGVEPEHLFQLFIDLRQPLLLDPERFVSSPTPNETNLSIRGSRGGWRAGIEEAVRKRIRRKHPLRTYIHGGHVYDVFLMLIGLPLAFYSCWRMAAWLNDKLAGTSPVLVAAGYLYVGLAALWIYRILFSYTKWAFPMVEITDQGTRPAKHRKIWWGLVVLLGGKIFWDIADPFVSAKLWWQTAIAYAGP